MSVKRTFISLFLATFVLTTLACSFTNLLPWSKNAADGVDKESIRQAAKTEEAMLEDRQITRTPVTETTADVSINYVYTDSLVTALYHLYGSVLDDFVDISITNNKTETMTFLVQSQVDGFTSKASDTFDVAPGETYELHQNPRLLTEAINQLSSEKPGNFHIRVSSLDNATKTLLVDDTAEIHMFSRRDFVWIDDMDWPQQYELWAAWVTPNDPAVEALLRKAANYTKSGMMLSGYGGEVNDESGSLRDRLQAIWRAEQDYNLTYISTMKTFGPKTIQRMRLPAEVLDQASGNCVELVFLYNAAVEALGLESAIVRIPGHAFIAVRMDTENANYYFIETTIIGQHNFDTALKAGAADWEDAQPHFDAKETGYAWVTIPLMREKGILPIPWN